MTSQSDANGSADLSPRPVAGGSDAERVAGEWGQHRLHPATNYKGRFAPSPTGPLHAGSLVAALASWLDARASCGLWIVRIEDTDPPRCIPGGDVFILTQLETLGMRSDEPVVRQSERGTLYEAAMQALRDAGLAYPCACSRSDIETSLAAAGTPRPRHGELVYPGTCRPDRGGLAGRRERAVRLLVRGSPALRALSAGGDAADARPLHANDPCIRWVDRRLGSQIQNVDEYVGDFVLRRADGVWAYQLAVVVDDALQGVTAVVRGEDLADNTARQIYLQRLLGLPTPSYLHTPIVLGTNGEKLSKQNGAAPLDLANPVKALLAAGKALDLHLAGATVAEVLANAVPQWKAIWGPPDPIGESLSG